MFFKVSLVMDKYIITWVNKTSEKLIFEHSMAGAQEMKEGFNILSFPRKEMCLALARQLKTKFKISNYKIYRMFPTGEIQFIHPKDGVFPEKVNQQRLPIGLV